MTNKTITLSPDLAERIIDAYAPHDNNPHCHLNCDGEALDELRDALADPVPPAGGDVEVLAWRVKGTDDKPSVVPCVFFERPGAWSDNYTVTELVDRAHVTRLQAEKQTHIEYIGKLEQALNAAAGERDALQSELTKARECIGRWVGMLDTPATRQEMLEGMRTYLSNQSAPADKGQGEPVAWTWTGALEDLKLGANCISVYRREGPGTPVPLYAEQLAPVAVVPDERKAFEEWWRANMNIGVMGLRRNIYPMDSGWSYACHETNRAWMARQARARLNGVNP